MNQKNITDQLRNRFTADLAEFLAAKYDVDVCQTAAGTIMIPAVDCAGEDRWVKFSCIIGEGKYAAKYTAVLKVKFPKLKKDHHCLCICILF